MGIFAEFVKKMLRSPLVRIYQFFDCRFKDDMFQRKEPIILSIFYNNPT